MVSLAGSERGEAVSRGWPLVCRLRLDPARSSALSPARPSISVCVRVINHLDSRNKRTVEPARRPGAL